MTDSTMAKTRLNGTTLLVRPEQSLDNYSAPEMIEAISEALANNVTFVIVDMEQVEFISSAGAGSLVGNVEALRSRGGDLIICNLTAAVLHVFDILDLTDYLTISKDLSEAKALIH